MNNLIKVGQIIVNINEIQSLTYHQIGTYWISGIEYPKYIYQLCLKGQKPITIEADDYFELKRKIGEQ